MGGGYCCDQFCYSGNNGDEGVEALEKALLVGRDKLGVGGGVHIIVEASMATGTTVNCTP